MIRDEDGRALARYARASIAASLGGPIVSPPSFDGAGATAATFITLRRGGDLHGCIGTIEARRPLVDDVRANAVAAALFDPRATALRPEDVDDLTVEVSLLSPLERIVFTDEASAIVALRPGRDGVVLRAGGRRATFLPQVWRNLADPWSFLASLKTKAGYPASYWSEDLELLRYDVRKWTDPGRAAEPRDGPARVGGST